MKKILIIGGTGTISLPITTLLARDKEVELFVLNRGTNNKKLPSGIHHIKGDITDKEEVKKAIQHYDFDSVINFIVWNRENAKDNIEIFNGKTKQFIYISTVCVLNHEITCNIDEDCETGNQYSDYGMAKASAEQEFLKAYRDFHFPITIVRPTQTYSNHRIPLSIKGRECWSVVNRMLKGKEVIIHGDGQSVWASTHADDFAKGFYPLIGSPKTIGEIYQIMNNTPHTWDMLYQQLANLLEVDYKPVYISTELLKHSKQYSFSQSIKGDKHWSNIFDISKIKTISVNFECDIDIKEGLQKYLEYMEAHPEMKKEEPDFDAWCDETITLYKTMTQQFIKEIK